MRIILPAIRRFVRCFAVVLALGLALAACEEEQQERPAPHALTAEAMGKYCGMNLLEHSGPKGQIILKSALGPVWFSSARDAIAFTLLPDEPKDILAVYVSDMAKTDNWDDPGATNWVEARDAFYVIESRRRGGMGANEAIPFSDRAAAERFALRNGGRIVGFKDIPPAYILGSGDISETPEPPQGGATGHDIHK